MEKSLRVSGSVKCVTIAKLAARVSGSSSCHVTAHNCLHGRYLRGY